MIEEEIELIIGDETVITATIKYPEGTSEEEIQKAKARAFVSLVFGMDFDDVVDEAK